MTDIRCKLVRSAGGHTPHVHLIARTTGDVRPLCGGRGVNAASTYTVTDDKVTCPTCLAKAGR